MDRLSAPAPTPSGCRRCARSRSADRGASPAATAAFAFGCAPLGETCLTPSYVPPPTTTPATTTAATFAASRRTRRTRRAAPAPPVAAPTAANPPAPPRALLRSGPVRHRSPASGTSTSAFNARRCARWLCARLLHSAHARRCARSARRSPSESRPSSCLLIASAASSAARCCSSSCSRSARRARKSSVSSADTLMPSTSAISAYELPSSSRITSAARWFGGSCDSARRSSSAVGAVDPRRPPLADALVERDLARAALRLAEPLAADVVRDRDQPAVRLLRPRPALERAIGVEERRLGDVLRVRRRRRASRASSGRRPRRAARTGARTRLFVDPAKEVLERLSSVPSRPQFRGIIRADKKIPQDGNTCEAQASPLRVSH